MSETTTREPLDAGHHAPAPNGADGHGPVSAAGTSPDLSGVEASATQRPPWGKRLLISGISIAAILLITIGIRHLLYMQTHPSTDDAYCTTDVYQITPQVPGAVIQVLVNDNQKVTKGQLLAVIDPSTFEAAVESARADLAVAQAAAGGAADTVGVTQQSGAAELLAAAGSVAQAGSATAGAEADANTARAVVTGAVAGVGSAQAAVDGANANLRAQQASEARLQQVAAAARADVAAARAAAGASQAAVTAAASNLGKAQRDAERYRTLHDQQAISDQTYDAAVAAATAAQAQRDSAVQEASAATAMIAQKQAALAAALAAVKAQTSAVVQARDQVTAAKHAAASAYSLVVQAQSRVDSARQSVLQDHAKQQQAEAKLAIAREAPQQLQVTQHGSQVANARVAAAKAELDTALIALRNTRILAPITGRISKKNIDIGEHVAIGQPLMALVPDRDVWVDANFDETQLKGMQAGEQAEIQVDAIPGVTFRGHLDSISAATGATFALLPPDNATGNFTKVVQRVPVKVTFDAGQPNLNRLRGGLSASVTVDTGSAH
ncbi:MAG: HlyD family secretion protein [Armatimonadetes bacterium]|nr:HlyD family secretion protein [Armatimonadota bacterium]MDE2206244.1 HlyD family secretion protein [Armatimonadota bacterium]